jgi:hypothetical protein
MEVALQDAWNNIFVNKLDSLVSLMAEQIQAVIIAKVGSTHW